MLPNILWQKLFLMLMSGSLAERILLSVHNLAINEELKGTWHPLGLSQELIPTSIILLFLIKKYLPILRVTFYYYALHEKKIDM